MKISCIILKNKLSLHPNPIGETKVGGLKVGFIYNMDLNPNINMPNPEGDTQYSVYGIVVAFVFLCCALVKLGCKNNQSKE